MFETAENLVGMTHTNNDALCFVLEFMNPKIRSVSSELVCALSADSLVFIIKGINNAYYLSLSKSEMSKLPLPLIVSSLIILKNQEKFDVQIYEEGAVVNFDI